MLIIHLEPDSLANLVTNMAVSKCANAHDAYLEGTNYAVTQLNLANVAMYLDAGKHFSNLTAHVARELIRELSNVSEL